MKGRKAGKREGKMQFLVSKFTCEMLLDDDGNVVTRWFLSDGRGADAPKYLNRAERKQYQAGREAFMEKPARYALC
jgi:hypothetical protein